MKVLILAVLVASLSGCAGVIRTPVLAGGLRVDSEQVELVGKVRMPWCALAMLTKSKRIIQHVCFEPPFDPDFTGPEPRKNAQAGE